MALRKALAQRLFSVSRDPKPPFTTLQHSPIPSPSFQPLGPTAKTSSCREYSPESYETGFYRRFLQRRDIPQSAASRLPEVLTLPVGDKLKEKLRGINDLAGDRIRLDGLAPPSEHRAFAGGISVGDARKILRLAQVERLKATLREIPKNSISYSEFVEICGGHGVSNHDQGIEFAKMMDESGNVIVLGNTVFLRPERVAKSMEALISESAATQNDPRRKELDQMEKHKATIDSKAQAQVRRELYCGLGLLLAQTIGFMRLTFWELSWDVMEPICFFVTSLHFVAGYAFFLRTSSEPSFEGYFGSRFRSKQKRLMVAQGFDIKRYNELRRAC